MPQCFSGLPCPYEILHEEWRKRLRIFRFTGAFIDIGIVFFLNIRVCLIITRMFFKEELWNVSRRWMRVRIGSFKLIFILELVKFPINSLYVQQFLMSACFPDPTMVKHNNPVGILNSGKAMGNNDGGSSGKQLL